jgi:dTDP-4-dehydrorhamnose 3,5-epimerase-like enzyme
MRPEARPEIAWDDAGLGINWPVEEANAVLSDRDRALPPLSRARLEL